jgi:hypothetical protein
MLSAFRTSPAWSYGQTAKSTTAPADNTLKNVSDYRFPEATRKNNSPAKTAAEGYVPLAPRAVYLYSRPAPRNSASIPRATAGELPSCRYACGCRFSPLVQAIRYSADREFVLPACHMREPGGKGQGFPAVRGWVSN